MFKKIHGLEAPRETDFLGSCDCRPDFFLGHATQRDARRHGSCLLLESLRKCVSATGQL